MNSKKINLSDISWTICTGDWSIRRLLFTTQHGTKWIYIHVASGNQILDPIIRMNDDHMLLITSIKPIEISGWNCYKQTSSKILNLNNLKSSGNTAALYKGITLLLSREISSKKVVYKIIFVKNM
jgi:hypothetical protein